LLDSAKLLYRANQPRLRANVLRAVGERVRGAGRMSDETWETLQRHTAEEGFGHFDSEGDFIIYPPYLEQCVLYDPLAADMYGQELSHILQELDKNGLIYLRLAPGRNELERIRGSMARGPHRTIQLQAGYGRNLDWATQVEYTPKIVQALFDTGSLGNRVFALGLIQVHRDPKCLNIMLRVIKEPPTQFEQSIALGVTKSMIELKVLSENQERDVATAIETLLRSGDLQQSRARKATCQAILTLLGRG